MKTSVHRAMYEDKRTASLRNEDGDAPFAVQVSAGRRLPRMVYWIAYPSLSTHMRYGYPQFMWQQDDLPVYAHKENGDTAVFSAFFAVPLGAGRAAYAPAPASISLEQDTLKPSEVYALLLGAHIRTDVDAEAELA